MWQHFIANNMVGFEQDVSNEDLMEQVAQEECLHNCNIKHFKDRKKKASLGKICESRS